MTLVSRYPSSKGALMTRQPHTGDTVVIYPGSDREATGRIIDDFGEFTAHSVDIGDTHIADPARRWAILTDTGSLEFVDTEHLAHPDD